MIVVETWPAAVATAEYQSEILCCRLPVTLTTKNVFTSRAHEGTVKNMIFCCGVGAGEVENLFNFFFVSSFKIRAKGMFVKQALVGLAWKLVVAAKAGESRALKLLSSRFGMPLTRPHLRPFPSSKAPPNISTHAPIKLT